MALQELPGTVDFLTDAAHLLRMTAPETSAHLMNQRRDLLSQYNIAPSEFQRQHVCGACGNIMIAGQDAAIKIATRKAIRKVNGASKSRPATKTTPSEGARMKTIQCGSCKRITSIALPSPGLATRRRVVASANPKKVVEEPKITANASSKKRAKNRKAGLQALLSGQKQQQGANPLSLASLLKK